MAKINADEITQLLREQIRNYDQKIQVDEVGTVISLVTITLSCDSCST